MYVKTLSKISECSEDQSLSLGFLWEGACLQVMVLQPPLEKIYVSECLFLALM